MDNVVDKVLEIFKEEKVNKKQIPNLMIELYDKINHRLWEKISVSPVIFYNLKDTVWYNLEHLPMGGEEKGMSDLRYLGKKYSNFISACSNDFYVDEEQIELLLNELKDISKKWSDDWIFVQLITKSDEMWSADEKNPTPIVIYDANKEGPTKYGYGKKNKSVILDKNGEDIYENKRDVVHCCIETKMGTYGKSQLLKGFLDSFIISCDKALKSKKGICFDFENYDYL